VSTVFPAAPFSSRAQASSLARSVQRRRMNVQRCLESALWRDLNKPTPSRTNRQGEAQRGERVGQERATQDSRAKRDRVARRSRLTLNPAVGYNLKRASPHPRPFSQREKGVEPLAFWKRDWGEGMRRLMGHCGHFGKTAVFRLTRLIPEARLFGRASHVPVRFGRTGARVSAACGFA
jgi:hypothetical protein